jgi:hypothetical protein
MKYLIFLSLVVGSTALAQYEGEETPVEWAAKETANFNQGMQQAEVQAQIDATNQQVYDLQLQQMYPTTPQH